MLGLLEDGLFCDSDDDVFVLIDEWDSDIDDVEDDASEIVAGDDHEFDADNGQGCFDVSMEDPASSTDATSEAPLSNDALSEAALRSVTPSECNPSEHAPSERATPVVGQSGRVTPTEPAPSEGKSIPRAPFRERAPSVAGPSEAVPSDERARVEASSSDGQHTTPAVQVLYNLPEWARETLEVRLSGRALAMRAALDLIRLDFEGSAIRSALDLA